MISYAHDQEQAARQRAADSAHLAEGGEKGTRCHTMLLGMVVGAAVGGLITYMVREYVAAAQAMAAKGSDPSGAVAGGTPAGSVAASPPSPAPASPVEKPAASSILEDTKSTKGTHPYFPKGYSVYGYFASIEGDVTGEDVTVKCRAYYKLKKYSGTLGKAGFGACAANLLCLHWSEEECDDMMTLSRLFAQDFKAPRKRVEPGEDTNLLRESQASRDFKLHNLTALRDEKNITLWLRRFGVVLTSNVLDNKSWSPGNKGFVPTFRFQVLIDRFKEAGLTPARLKSKPAKDFVSAVFAGTAYA